MESVRGKDWTVDLLTLLKGRAEVDPLFKQKLKQELSKVDYKLENAHSPSISRLMIPVSSGRT